tara:strand:- start:679 stop:1278 length:600 start_codon:yes stop_codon:yes gene_type:complete
MQKDFKNDKKIKKDLDLLVNQSLRCREILKKLSLNPNLEDKFIDSNLTLYDYVNEIVRSYLQISSKKFEINTNKFNNPIIIQKSSEIMYGLRNFIGNANKFSKKKIDIILISDKKNTEIIIKDDGPGFPKDLIDKHRLGEPYIRTSDKANIMKYGLGLGTFIGKSLLEKNYAKLTFKNSDKISGANVFIKWNNNKLSSI